MQSCARYLVKLPIWDVRYRSLPLRRGSKLRRCSRVRRDDRYLQSPQQSATPVHPVKRAHDPCEPQPVSRAFGLTTVGARASMNAPCERNAARISRASSK